LRLKGTDHKYRTFITVRLVTRPSIDRNWLLPAKDAQRQPKPDVYGIQCVDCGKVVKTDLTKAQTVYKKRLFSEELKHHVCDRKI